MENEFKHQTHEDDEIKAMSPKEEADFRQSLEDLLQQLDREETNFEEDEQRKINDLERIKNSYLDHADKMAARARGELDKLAGDIVQSVPH